MLEKSIKGILVVKTCKYAMAENSSPFKSDDGRKTAAKTQFVTPRKTGSAKKSVQWHNSVP